jgi:hypothetical protein
VGWRWGKNVDMSQYFHALYHASITHTFATPLTHNFPMSCYRFVTYSPWYESSKAWQQWGKSIGKMWKTTPNVVVSWHVSSTQCRWAAYSKTWFGCHSFAAQRHERAPTILNMSNRSIPRSASGPIPQLSGYVLKKINQSLINV